MKYSLWMIEDILKEFSPEPHFRTTVSASIEHARLITPNTPFFENTLYIGNGESLLLEGEKKDCVVCMQRGSYLLLNTTDVYQVFNVILNAFDQYDKWYQTIQTAIADGVMLKEIIDLFGEVLPYPLLILDSAQTRLATSSDFGLGTVDDMWDSLLTTGSIGMENMLKCSPDYQTKIPLRTPYEMPKGFFPYESYCQNIYVKDEFMGFISLIIKDDVFSMRDRDIFSILHESICYWFALYADRNEILMKNSIFHELVHRDYTHLEQFAQALQTMGWEAEDEKIIVILNCISDNVNMNLHIIKTFNRNYLELYAVAIDNQIVLLCDTTRLCEEQFIQYLEPIIQNSGYYGGISHTFTNLHDIAHFYMQARIALENGTPKIGEITSCENHILPYVLKLIQTNTQLDISHPALGKLQEYDEKHHTNYYDLLYLYLQNECNQTRTAELAHLHRSTLIQKINRITSISGIDLSDYRTRFYLCLSYEYRLQLSGKGEVAVRL
ncbi:MAG: helix-turn-helix domain-containing protein [Clostridiales bacterium]|nr:helix-turn-helix domain-containing protein [Clostridiales bacterium]